jgi:hypothetical protein
MEARIVRFIKNYPKQVEDVVWPPRIAYQSRRGKQRQSGYQTITSCPFQGTFVLHARLPFGLVGMELLVNVRKDLRRFGPSEMRGRGVAVQKTKKRDMGR